MTTNFSPVLGVLYIPENEVCEGYTGISLSRGRSAKCLSRQLLLQFQSDWLYTWQKCPFGVVDVQDANFVKVPSKITELLPLILLKSACPDNSSYSFCPIHFILGRSFH